MYKYISWNPRQEAKLMFRTWVGKEKQLTSGNSQTDYLKCDETIKFFSSITINKTKTAV